LLAVEVVLVMRLVVAVLVVIAQQLALH